MITKILLVASIVSCSMAASLHSSENIVPHSNEATKAVSPELALLQKVYDDCQEKNDFMKCLKGKAVTALNRAAEQDQIQLFDGVALVKQNETTDEDIPGLTDPRTLNDLSAIDRALIKGFGQLFKTHFVRVDMSEGRGKKNKSSKYIIMALMTAMSIAGPLGLKALAAIAGKALVISKVALTIAGIIALKKLFSTDHHEETSFQVHAGGDHNRRNAYVIRPVKAAAAVSPASVDPYRYYYDQQYAATA